MSKKPSKSTAEKFAVLSTEELQKLTPEAQQEYFLKLQEAHTALAAEADQLLSTNATLEAEAKKLKKEKKQEELPSFEVEEDEENDIEGGEYQFTAPSFTWDDNSVIDVRELVAAAEGIESKDPKIKAKADKAAEIISKLIARKSGIIAIKPGKED